ncbi:GNAT family N-acetyltransferase [Breznakiella homolactica]|uniref:GNAT family N-acetyltransferase n=1 Tax=Breznakiella homolactica TaxID=2798577 RepID=A0A7T8BBF5_9SPIR|nr:GNAT family N-acetyltransferase [Breznakiella homolactica]QQO10356.1 GNAT family N-acetyltransferase [Breznakiella homolactica]
MIRKIIYDDIPQAASMFSSVWKSTYKDVFDESFLEKRTADFFQNSLEKVIKEHLETMYIYEEDQNIYGIISGNILHNKNYDCEIIRLYISLDSQGKGIGTNLLNYMQEYYRSNGCKEMIIWAIKGLRNNDFYKKRGGREVENMEKTFGDKQYPMIGYGYNLA